MSIPSVNRCALIVTRRQPYADWANSFDDDGPGYDLTEQQKNPTIYLITEPDDPTDLEKSLKRHWRRVFEEELSAWMIDRAVWPQHRTFEMFCQWFDVTVLDLVLDLSRKYLEAE